MIVTVILALSLSDWLARAIGESNTHAAVARGIAQFAKKDYASATRSFERANAPHPSPSSAFNLGTAQVAAGRREEGSATLGKAMADPTMREMALYNRGNSALAAKAWDYAIRDYTSALKLNSADVAAKRNLEIALARKQAEQKQGEGKKNQPGPGNENQPKPAPGPPTPGQPQAPGKDADAEAILRSVQQQEQEELSRMRKPRSEKVPVGW